MISRRQMLVLAGAAPFWSVLKPSARAQGAPQTTQNPITSKDYPRMGGTPTAFMLRSMAAKGSATSFEMITRDPLKIPVFTTKYWATFDDAYSPLPARDLAKVLALVKKNRPKTPLPRTSGLSREQQVKLEDEYNLKCIAYARQNLDL